MLEQIDNLFVDIKLLNKKRKKSKSKRKSRSCISPKVQDNTLNLTDRKNYIATSKRKFHYFFNFDWEEGLFEKETFKICKFLDGCIFWFLINSSYFEENNLENNILNITSKYLGKINNNNNCENKKINKADLSIISLLNLDKEGKYLNNIFCNEINKDNLSVIKGKLINYINSINKINEERIKKLSLKAKIIQNEYNKENPTNLIKEENIDYKEEKPIENYMYSRNIKSFLIRKKYWNYLHKKEKDFLIERDSEEINTFENNNFEGEQKILLNNCSICNCGDLGQYDNLYECVICGIIVHQECYGIKSNTEQKNWKCSKCKKMKYKEAMNLACLLCPCKGGAMKQTKISKESDFYTALMTLRGKNSEENNDEENISIIKKDSFNINNKYQDNAWIHLTCAFGNKNVKINMNGKKKNIKFEENNIIKSYHDYCDICKLKNYGPTIKCKIEECNINCHPECARMNECYIELENFKLSFYCNKHRPNRFMKYFNKLAKSYNDEIFFFGDALDCVYKLYSQYKRKEFFPLVNSEQKKEQVEEFIKSKKEIKNNKDKIKKRRYLKSIIKTNKLFNKDKKISIMTSKNIYSKKEKDEIVKNDSQMKLKQKSFSLFNHNSVNNNSINEINYLKNNLNYNNATDTSKALTECESKIIFSESQKNELTLNIINHIKNFIEKYRIICFKTDGKYIRLNKEEKDEFIEESLNDLTLSDIKEGNYEIYKTFDYNFDDVYKNEEDFRDYLEKNIKEKNIIEIEIQEKNGNQNNEINKNKGKSKRKIGKSKCEK